MSGEGGARHLIVNKSRAAGEFHRSPTVRLLHGKSRALAGLSYLISLRRLPRVSGSVSAATIRMP